MTTASNGVRTGTTGFTAAGPRSPKDWGRSSSVPINDRRNQALTFLKEADDGMFERDRVTLRHPERTVTHSEGDWGGAVSSRQDTDGNPRLIAGFSGVSFEESDGSEGEFFGSFLGLSESFRETGESGPLPESED